MVAKYAKRCVVCGKEYVPYKNATETQKYCSKECRDRLDKNGRRFSGKREYIFRRDGYICAVCSSGNNLVVHHKDADKFNNNENNLITLCRSCHAKIHGTDYRAIRQGIKKCAICGEEFYPVHKNQLLCRSKACRAEWKKLQKRSQHESVKCAICGKVFVQSHRNHKTCSPECRHEYDKQKKRQRYYDDREAQLERQKRYYEKNKERIKAYVTEWRKANPDKVASYYGQPNS